MKIAHFPILLLMAALIAGCYSPAANPPVDDGKAPADSSETTSGAGAGESAAVSTDDDSSVAQPPRQLALTVPDVDSAPKVDEVPGVEDADADSDSVADEPAPPTSADYQRQLMVAVRADDMPKAFTIVNAAIADFPNDVNMKINRLLLHMRHDDATAQSDPDAAAQQFVATAILGRDLLELGDELPTQSRQFIPYVLFNEARGFAHQGQIAESLKAMESAVDAGLPQITTKDDAFFAAVRDNEDFKAGLEALLTVIRERLRESARREIEKTVPFAFDFELPDLDANPVKLADFKGKLLIVDIWGTWCPPCREGIPHFIRLKEEYADDLAIVGINYEGEDGEEAVEKIRSFVQDNGINYPCVIGDQPTQDQVPNFGGFPTTLLLDRDGTVRLVVLGYHPYDQLDAYINVLLDEGSSGDAAG